jgi:hypothetical protein
MLTVHELRKHGFKVKVNHYKTVSGMGGATTIDIDGGPFSRPPVTGTALCNHQDRFNRRLGVRIALGRALKKIGLPTK